jgi:hypothetical protein
MDPIMLTQVTNDLCRTLKHNLARFDNDASACYDRIIVALAMLAARRCGMPGARHPHSCQDASIHEILGQRRITE